MRIAIYTLGCKVNQVETQAMERELIRRGHALADFDGPADPDTRSTPRADTASGSVWA